MWRSTPENNVRSRTRRRGLDLYFVRPRGAYQGLRPIPMPEIDIDPTIGEYLIPGEAAIVDKYLAIFGAHMRKHYDGKGIVARRAIHAKSHGCLRATLEVLPHGDPDLRHGIFRAPATYDAIVRVSNGDGPPGPDKHPLVSMGFAIKVRGVEAEKHFRDQTENSQDFLFFNQPAYMTRDVRDYLSLMRGRDGGLHARAWAFVRNWRGLSYRRKASPKDNPLNTSYWSGAPFRLGNTAIKYLIRPSEPQPVDKRTLQKMQSENHLKPLVRQHIENRAADFEFFLHKRVIDGREVREMPIEDFSVAWDEQKSVPVHVARLRIPQQRLDDAFDQECEHMVFSPWNTTRDFRPIGSLNRARAAVYFLSSRRRHELNETPNPFA